MSTLLMPGTAPAWTTGAPRNPEIQGTAETSARNDVFETNRELAAYVRGFVIPLLPIAAIAVAVLVSAGL